VDADADDDAARGGEDVARRRREAVEAAEAVAAVEAAEDYLDERVAR